MSDDSTRVMPSVSGEDEPTRALPRERSVPAYDRGYSRAGRAAQPTESNDTRLDTRPMQPAPTTPAQGRARRDRYPAAGAAAGMGAGAAGGAVLPPRSAQAGTQHGQPGQPGVGVPARRTKRRHPVRWIVLTLVLLVLAFVVGVPAYAWSRVTKVDAAPAGTRPAAAPGTTYLLVGSDSRAGLTAAQRHALATGNAAGTRTDTIMLLDIPKTGNPVLVSIPRDSYVSIPGHGKNKINAAFALGGPKLLVRTVEQATNVRVDHYVEIGFGGFVNVIDSLGGIRMCVARAMNDKKAGINLKAGCQQLTGAQALGYVRARYSDPLGDLGRVQRQRQMVSAVAKKALSAGTLANPVRYPRVAVDSAKSIVISTGTSPLDMYHFATALRSVAGGNGITTTVPIANANLQTSAGDSVEWNKSQAKSLFAVINSGDTRSLTK